MLTLLIWMMLAGIGLSSILLYFHYRSIKNKNNAQVGAEGLLLAELEAIKANGGKLPDAPVAAATQPASGTPEAIVAAALAAAGMSTDLPTKKDDVTTSKPDPLPAPAPQPEQVPAEEPPAEPAVNEETPPADDEPKLLEPPEPTEILPAHVESDEPERQVPAAARFDHDHIDD